MKIAVVGQSRDLDVITELLSPWDVQFTPPAEAEIQIVHNNKSLQTFSTTRKKTVFIPLHSVSERGLSAKKQEQVRVNSILENVLRTSCSDPGTYGKSNELKNCCSSQDDLNENLVVLEIDILKEYSTILNNALNVKPSILYRVLTGLPIPYAVAPGQVRDLIMRSRKERTKPSLSRNLLDALRFILVSAIEWLLKRNLEKRTWNGKRYACIVTHDIDTGEGLARAHCMKRMEEKYDIPSAWYVPSKNYVLNPGKLAELCNYGEIGAHDTKHDGKLVYLPKDKVVKRLIEARIALSKCTQVPVDGFRAPLLQHSFVIIDALQKAGYNYDTSMPTWETKHPTTMKSNGIQTVYPMTFNGIVEIPVTLQQDHQMMHVLGMTPDQTIQIWTRQMKIIREIGALCLILVHPDYELGRSENTPLYEELLNSIKIDNDCWITLPREMTKHVSG